jgi:hypothetical protein
LLKSTWSVANRALFEDGFETAGLLGNYVKSYDETVKPLLHSQSALPGKPRRQYLHCDRL